MHMNNNCVNKTVDVFMDKSVVNKINALIHRDPFHECGGIFIEMYPRIKLPASILCMSMIFISKSALEPVAHSSSPRTI